MNLRDIQTPLHVRLLAACTGLVLIVGVACTNRESVDLEGPTAGGFGSPDAGADGDTDASLPETRMCPVTTCSSPWATCPSSDFPCDVNLLSDDNNCGGCGIRCGGETGLNSKWICLDGVCSFGCSGSGWRDCDNDATNGCESYAENDPQNCGLCGRTCKADEYCEKGACIDYCAAEGLPDSCPEGCTDLSKDDYNCGKCGNECDRAGPNKPPLPEGMYYGCQNGACGHAKCSEPGMSDCNGNVSDGCEVRLHTKDNCGSCGDACPDGKQCGFGGTWRCLCDEGKVMCFFGCVSVSDDPLNCGGCNRVCPGMNLPHFAATCTVGVCSGECAENYADCDGVQDNGCEVDTLVDNRNCGGCRKACAKNQVCREGKCLVAPCEPGVEPTQ